MWPFDTFFNKKDLVAKEEELSRKIKESQDALLLATTSTADAAQHVTSKIKARLEDSIRQFEATVALITDALIICDETGTILAVNPAASKLFQCEESDFIGTPVLSRFSRFSGLLNLETLWAAIDGKEASAGLLRGRTCEGATFDVDVTSTKLERSDGSSLILLLIRDISLHKDIEIKEKNFRSLFDLSFDGILIVQDETIVAANLSAGMMFGTDPRMLLAKRLDSLVDLNEREILGRIDDAPTKEPVEVEARNNGKLMQLLFSSASIVWNKKPAFLVTVKDVSEMRRLMTRLRRDNGVDMICVFGTDYKIMFANESFANYYGIEREKIIGDNLFSIIPAGEKESLLLNISGLTVDNPSRRMQHQTTNKDGNIILQDWIDHATFDQNGNIVEYQRSGRDVSVALEKLLNEK